MYKCTLRRQKSQLCSLLTFPLEDRRTECIQAVERGVPQEEFFGEEVLEIVGCEQDNWFACIVWSLKSLQANLFLGHRI